MFFFNAYPHEFCITFEGTKVPTATGRHILRHVHSAMMSIPSPRITRFPLTRISTYADFRLCTGYWGNSALVETLVQSH